MKKIVLLSGAVLGGLSVVFGAFGAHLLKKKLLPEAIESFNTGVKYQIYHALLLLILGIWLSFNSQLENLMAWSLIVGTLLFSFSIYFLSLSRLWDVSLKWLGPVTPLGGLLLIIGWAMLAVLILKKI